MQSGDVPDLISFDLIFMPDFMKAGFLTDLTETLGADPNQAKVAQAFQDLATYDGKLYGTGFTPDVSILLYNKDLFAQGRARSGKAADDDRRARRNMPPRSTRPIRASMATTSRAHAAAATSSPRRR